MSKPSLSETLQEMARNHASRSKTARLRDVFDDVETALNAGVSREAVLQALNDDGIAMTKQTFDKALSRIRKERQVQKPVGNERPSVTTPGAAPMPATPSASVKPVLPAGDVKPWVSPADLAKARDRPVDLQELSKTKPSTT